MLGIRLGGKHLPLLDHLAGPRLRILSDAGSEGSGEMGSDVSTKDRSPPELDLDDPA